MCCRLAMFFFSIIFLVGQRNHPFKADFVSFISTPALHGHTHTGVFGERRFTDRQSRGITLIFAVDLNMSSTTIKAAFRVENCISPIGCLTLQIQSYVNEFSERYKATRLFLRIPFHSGFLFWMKYSPYLNRMLSYQLTTNRQLSSYSE